MNLTDNNPAHTTIAEIFPELNRIMLFVAFEEADSAAEPNYRQIIFTADAVADFRLDCSRDACVGGGFDFAPIVAEIVGSRESIAHGRLGCGGRLGSGGSPCSLQAEFRIIVD